MGSALKTVASASVGRLHPPSAMPEDEEEEVPDTVELDEKKKKKKKKKNKAKDGEAEGADTAGNDGDATIPETVATTAAPAKAEAAGDEPDEMDADGAPAASG